MREELLGSLASGLQKCVESLGLTFEGRAHDGLIDCRNTAAIVLHMAQGSMLYGAFAFRRATRGLDRDGNVFGSRAHRALSQFSQLFPGITMEARDALHQIS
ncbi:eri2 [Symbiodinium microadriaticum]|nr:eri2 [Symbiodinium microadriaticum]